MKMSGKDKEEIELELETQAPIVEENNMISP